MSESTQRREYMLLSIRHLRSIAPRGSRIEIRNPKLEIRNLGQFSESIFTTEAQ
jgi:hypothetical protein